MADYTDLPTVKSALGKLSADDRDELIAQSIKAASRWIDRHCGRAFSTDVAATARTFRVSERAMRIDLDDVVRVDDIASTTDLAVAVGRTGSWSTVTGWEPGPDNAAVYGRPYTQIRAAAGWLPCAGRVQVTARWGWPEMPGEVGQACTLLAARLYRRKDSPQGVLGSADWGFTRVSRTDPDVEALLAPFVIPMVA